MILIILTNDNQTNFSPICNEYKSWFPKSWPSSPELIFWAGCSCSWCSNRNQQKYWNENGSNNCWRSSDKKPEFCLNYFRKWCPKYHASFYVYINIFDSTNFNDLSLPSVDKNRWPYKIVFPLCITFSCVKDIVTQIMTYEYRITKYWLL